MFQWSGCGWFCIHAVEVDRAKRGHEWTCMYVLVMAACGDLTKVCAILDLIGTQRGKVCDIDKKTPPVAQQVFIVGMLVARGTSCDLCVHNDFDLGDIC